MREKKENASRGSDDPKTIIDSVLKEHRYTPLAAASTLQELALDAENAGRFAYALAFNAAQLEEAELYSSAPYAIHGHLTRGRLFLKIHQPDVASGHIERALKLSSLEKGVPLELRNRVCYAATRLMSDVFAHKGDLVKADDTLQRCADIATSLFGESSKERIQAMYDRTLLAVPLNLTAPALLQRIAICRTEILKPSHLSQGERAHMAHTLGTILYTQGMWDEACFTLDIAASLSTNNLQKTESLLTIATIASYKGDTTTLSKVVDRAAELWMDIAPLPRIERYIAHLRSIAAISEGCSVTYHEQIKLAQEVGPDEELNLEERINVLFARATHMRLEGLESEAQSQIEEAHRITRRGVTSALSRFNLYLQRGYCEHVDGRFAESNSLVDEALIIAKKELKANPILTARALTLRAHNGYALYTFNEGPNHGARKALQSALRDGDGALEILTSHDLDPQSRKSLLRLLSGVANHLDLPVQQIRYDKELALMNWKFPEK